MSKQNEGENTSHIFISELGRASDKVKYMNDGIDAIMAENDPDKYGNIAAFVGAFFSYIVEHDLDDAAAKSIIDHIFTSIGKRRETLPALGEIIVRSLDILAHVEAYESNREKKMGLLLASIKDFSLDGVGPLRHNVLFGGILDNINIFSGSEGIIIDKIHQLNPIAIPSALNAMFLPDSRPKRGEQIKSVIKHLFLSELVEEEKKKEIFAEVWEKNRGEIRILSEGMPDKYKLGILSRIFVQKKINEKNSDNLVSIAKELAGMLSEDSFRLLFYTNVLPASSQPDQGEFREKLINPIAAIFTEDSNPRNIFKEAFEFAVQEGSVPKFKKLIEILFSPELASKASDIGHSIVARALGFAAINNFPLDKDLISSVPDSVERSKAVSYSLILAAEKNATSDQIGKLIGVAVSCGCYEQDGSRTEDGGNNVVTSSLVNFFRRNFEKDSNWSEQFRNLLRAVQATKKDDYLPMINNIDAEFKKDGEGSEICKKFQSFIEEFRMIDISAEVIVQYLRGQYKSDNLNEGKAVISAAVQDGNREAIVEQARFLIKNTEKNRGKQDDMIARLVQLSGISPHSSVAANSLSANTLKPITGLERRS